MYLRPFIYKSRTYTLDHLSPFELKVTQEAKEKKPERIYVFDVNFSIHCFTREKGADESIDQSLLYSDSRETRVFCFDRYELSKRLKDIVISLEYKKCYHTSHGNYFIVEVTSENNLVEEYEVYFTVSKSSKKGRLNLYIQSAYIRNTKHNNGRRKKKPIGFKIIAFNTLTNKPIKVPQ